ncbi:hypothetical protein ABT410_23795 (plasmid) [Escherichia coli]
MWYREGTITFTQGSNTLVGAGTAWNVTANGVLPGMIVIGPDNKLYEIKRVISDTNIVLSEPYTGETQSEVPCRIITTYEGDLTQFSARFTALMSRMSADSKSMRSWLTALDEVTIEREDGTEVTVKPLIQIVNEHNENVEWYKNNTDAIDAAGDKAREAAASAAAAAESANTAGEKASQASQSASAAESSKSAAATSAGAAKTSETNAAASQKSAATSASTATTKASEAATSARDAAASKEAAKSSETSAASSASNAASSATAAGNSAKAAKTSETNARSSETAAGQSASAAAGSKTAAASSASAASTSAGQASASATAAGKSAESAASSASTATTKAGEATEQASAAARSASAAKTSETNAKASETRAESSKTAAASSASSAASSASSASASKDEATRQASAAKGSATTASTKATEAAGSATAASQSKTAAESAATRAEAAADRAEEIAGAVAMEDASLTTKGVVKLSSAVDSTSESLAATPKAVKTAYDNAEKRLQKDQNGADIPDKGRFLNNINVYSKGEVDQKKGMRYVVVNAPAGVQEGKYYPLVIKRNDSHRASRVVISTPSRTANHRMNNCEFNGFVCAGGWTDRGSYACGMFWAYSSSERAIHSILMSNKGDTVDSVFYIEGGAFPVEVFLEEGLSVTAPASDYVVAETTYKFGATDPYSESVAVNLILDFKQGNGFYSSYPVLSKSDISGNKVYANDEVIVRSQNALRMIAGDYGVIWRNDGANTYLLMTDKGDQYGGWNGLRPFAVNNATGEVTINTPLNSPKGVKGNSDTATKLQTARKISGVPFDGSTDITLTAAHVAAFARRATGSYADADGGVPWNAESGAYNVTRTGDSYILANFYTGVGSCRTLQIKAHYKNGGLFYRSSRDGYGFESGWEQVYTTGFMPQPADINAPTAAAGWLNSGNGTAFTTAQFITWLNNQGAFTNKHWIARCSWAYANNNYIDDTGCGRIDLSGSVIEVFSNKATSHYTIRVTTTTTSGHGGVNNAEFIYVYNGSDYAPGWRRSYNTRNKPTASDVGALSLSGGALTGGLTAAGEIISKSANGLRIAYGNYGFFIRNDGSSTYFMLTDSGNSLGTYNRLRPLIINNANGAVTIGNGLNVTGGINGSLNGNAATATKLQTARTIGGVSFDGSANINLPGVNIAGNQNTTGNAATATKLQTACTINGVSFDGSKNIELTAEDLNLEQTVELAAGSLQKNQNGADIPDKDRFLSNINVYSKGEVDKKKGMRQYAFNAPSNAVGGKWYPVIFRRSTGSTGELASRVIITTTSAGGNYEMNNCEFNGMVMPGGWTDRGSYAAGYFSTYQTNERAIHSIVTSLKEDDVCSVFYVEGRAFPVRVSAEEGLTVIVPTQDYTVGQTTYKWGATNPATESTNAQAILDFNNGRGFYCSHSIFGINAIFSGNLGIGTANALGGNSIVLGDNDTGFKQNGDGVLDAYANGVHVFRFRNGSAISLKGIQTGESKLFTLSSSNTAARNASFNLWGNSSRPTVAELGDDSGWHFYSQRNTDNSVIFSVNGQIQPNNWGNFDSRYVKDVRLGTRVVQLMARGGRYEKAGHAITGLRIIGEVDGDDEAIFRPIQKYINGTWYNVAQV